MTAPRVAVVSWLLYMLLISAARSVLAYRYRLAAPPDEEVDHWTAAIEKK